jgi:hypothetical protein
MSFLKGVFLLLLYLTKIFSGDDASSVQEKIQN